MTILLSRHEVEAEHRRPYILSGYRQASSFLHCLQYTLVLHNDMINFWTHFLPFVVWLTWFFALVSNDLDPRQPYNYPLMCMWVGSCCYTLFSSMAHLFSSKSVFMHKVCFMLDYLGIALYALGDNIASLFYVSSLSSPFFSHRNIVLAIEVCLALLATIVGSLSNVFWRDYRFVIRTVVFALPYIVYVSPFLHRQCVCWLYRTDCIPETAHLHYYSMLSSIIGAFFYVAKVPERVVPGRFDVFFQSHQLFHLCGVANTLFEMYFFPIEMKVRKEALLQVDGATPGWETTILPFAGTMVVGLAAVALLAVLTKQGVLDMNKIAKND